MRGAPVARPRVRIRAAFLHGLASEATYTPTVIFPTARKPTDDRQPPSDGRQHQTIHAGVQRLLDHPLVALAGMVLEQITSASGAPRDFIMDQILVSAIEARDVGA